MDKHINGEKRFLLCTYMNKIDIRGHSVLWREMGGFRCVFRSLTDKIFLRHESAKKGVKRCGEKEETRTRLSASEAKRKGGQNKTSVLALEWKDISIILLTS